MSTFLHIPLEYLISTYLNVIQIVYVGKAESQGAFKRVKDHFRGVMGSIAKCVLTHTKDGKQSEINI